MQAATYKLKTAAHQMVDDLPPNSTWNDLQYHIYVRQAIEAGLADAEGGRVFDVVEVQKQIAMLEQKFAKGARKN